LAKIAGKFRVFLWYNRVSGVQACRQIKRRQKDLE